MPSIRSTLLLTGAICALLGAPAARAGGPNVAVCLTLQESYNACIREQQRRQRGGWGGGWDGDEGRGDWGRRGGYDRDDDGYGRGYGGGYGGGYGRGYGGGYGRRHGGGGNPQAACMNWLLQIKAAGCF